VLGTRMVVVGPPAGFFWEAGFWGHMTYSVHVDNLFERPAATEMKFARFNDFSAPLTPKEHLTEHE
jgi:hypothetical protein